MQKGILYFSEVNAVLVSGRVLASIEPVSYDFTLNLSVSVMFRLSTD